MAAPSTAEKAVTPVEKVDKKEKGVAPPKPDEAKFKNRIDAVTVKIDAKKTEMKSLAEKIDKLSTGKEEYEEKKSELYEKMNSTKEKQQGIIEKKNELKRQEKESRQSQREREKQVKTLGKEAQEWSEETIDAKIRALEFQMSTTSMPLKKEKEMMMEIKNLRKRLPEAARIASELDRVKASLDIPTTSGSLPEQLEALEKEIQVLKKQQEEEFEAIQKLKKSREGKIGGVKELVTAKKAIKTAIDGLVKERDVIYDEKKAMQKAFNVWDREQRVEKQRKWEQEQAKQKEEWGKESARRELEKPNPFLDRTTLLEQTIDYCTNLMPKEDSDETEDRKAMDHSEFGGAKVLPSKKDREAEMYMTTTKKKALKNKIGKKKNQKIIHNAHTLAIFDDLKVAAPMHSGDLEPLVAKLTSVLNGYLEKTATWEAARKAKLETAPAMEVEAAAVAG